MIIRHTTTELTPMRSTSAQQLAVRVRVRETDSNTGRVIRISERDYLAERWTRHAAIVDFWDWLA